MRNAFLFWFCSKPARLVRLGLWLFFAGALSLLLGTMAQAGLLGPAWFVPDSPLGFTAAASLVSWGVWALGSGLRRQRTTAPGAARPAPLQQRRG